MRLAGLHYRALRVLIPRGIGAYTGPKTGSSAVQSLIEMAFTFLPPVDHKPLVAEFLRRTPSDSLDDYFSSRENQGLIRSDAVMGDGQCLLSQFARSHAALAEEYLGLPARRILCNVSVDALFRDSVNRRPDGYDGAVSFHRDVDAWRWLKIFVYLNDVGIGDGQHEVYLGSHRQFPPRLREIRRYEQRELDQYWSARMVTGPAGTCFAENTLAFHRAASPVNKGRLMLTAVYFDDSVKGIHPGAFRL